jgi:thiol-disulfide isomerase/thioredoxin
MSLTPSTMLPLGTKAFDFELLDTVSHQMITLEEVKSKVATVIMFICNHCPYVIHISNALAQVAKEYQAKDIQFIAINSNDVNTYPADSPEMMEKNAARNGYSFPYLFDDTQEVARQYQAACTPDFYVFDGELKCVYRGRFDESTPGNNMPVTGKDLTTALDNVLAGDEVDPDQFPSVGCNIKWKKY